MITITQPGASAGNLRTVSSFRAWQREVVDGGLLPVVAITGGRGKSTVVRMVEAILIQALLRVTTWTDVGVELRGKRQRREIGGWALALGRLAESTLDVALQELHWSTIHAVGLPSSSYPILAMTNLVGLSEEPPDADNPSDAMRSAYRAAAAAHYQGTLIASADDPAIYHAARQTQAKLVLTALARESPILSEHLTSGGSGVWVNGDTIFGGEASNFVEFCKVADLQSSFLGSVQFQIANALTAIGIASAIGVDRGTIISGLSRFMPTPEILPGSFNTFERSGLRVVIDALAPPWHLRTLLRALDPINYPRQITVVPDLSVIATHNIREAGRLLGRQPGVIVVHSNSDPGRVEEFRRGIAANDFPPIVIHLPTERRALNRALRIVRDDDLMLILTADDPGPAIRAVQRFMSSPSISPASIG